MLLTEPGKRAGNELTLQEQARALAAVLHDEFEAPFTLYRAATSEVIVAGGPVLRPDEVARVVEGGEAVVLSRAASSGTVRVAVVLHHRQTAQPTLVAAADLPSLAPAAAEREDVRLRRWLQSVADNLSLSGRQEGQTQALHALDELLAHVRLHRDLPRYQRRILETARPLIGARSLVWVPAVVSDAVLVEGEQILGAADCRKLASLLARSLGNSPLISNKDTSSGTWIGFFPQLESVLSLAVSDKGLLGYLLALNKTGSADEQHPQTFHSSDALLLSPFVGLLRLQLRTHQRYRGLEELLVGLTRSLTAALDAKDEHTYGHSERVGRIAVELSRELGLQGDDLTDVYLAGLLHDVGKIGIKDALLSRAQPLTPEELEHVEQHVTIGYNILAEVAPIRHLLPGVLYHHERFDGKGYPDGLAGEAIPRLARILAVADAYDELSTSQPDREALPCRRVEEVLTEGAGVQWDPEVIAAFQRCRLRIHAVRQRGVGESLRIALEGALNRQGPSKQGTRMRP